MVFLTPPFDVPEELQHFLRIYQCSQGHIYPSRQGNVVGGEMPVSIPQGGHIIIGNPRSEFDLKVSVQQIKDSLAVPLQPERTTFMYFPATVRWSPVPYLPAAAAVRLGRSLELTAIQLLYLGRAGTLAGYLLLAAAAVLLMPIHKWTMSLIALMPTSIFFAASLSADAVSIALSLLAIAMILRPALGDGPIGRRRLLGLGAVLTLLSLAKPGYVLISLLFLAVPKERFYDRWQCLRVRTWMVGVPLAVSIGWAISIRRYCVPLRPCVDAAAQAHWIIENPWTYLRLLVTTLTHPDLYRFAIANLGWGSIHLSLLVYILYWAALAATAILDGGRGVVRLPPTMRTWAIAVYFLVMTAISTLTYLAWQAVGEMGIDGVQSRYLIPVLPLFLLPLRNRAEAVPSRFAHWFVPALAILAVMVGVGTTWRAIILRFYWQ